MAETAIERPKRPKGWYSQAQRQARADHRATQRAQRDAQLNDLKRSRQTRDSLPAAIRRGAAAQLATLPEADTERARRVQIRTREYRRGRVEREALHKRWAKKLDGTPQTHEHASRVHQGALARLYRDGAIDADQLAAAVEIAAVAERIGADVSVRTASLETRIDAGRRGDGAFFESLSRVRHEIAYTRWRQAIGRLGPPGAVLDMIVGDTIGFTVVARRYRMRRERAKALLIEAIELWRSILPQAVKSVDQGDLDHAHARLTC